MSEPLTVLVDPPLSDGLVEQLIDLWVRVVNSGGAVGFIPPVVPADVRPLAADTFARVTAGEDTLVALAHPGGPVVAWLVLARHPSPLRQHWRTLLRVQVDPARQGHGIGRRLIAAAEEVARDRLGLRALALEVRGGTGTERLYERCGYVVVGRRPAAIWLADDDQQDEILMWRTL